MTMIIGIIIVGVLIYICAFNDKQTNQFEQKEQILISDVLAMYVGGLPYIVGGQEAYIGVSRDKIIIKFYDKNSNIKIINIKDVTKAEIQSEQQINQSIGVGKLIMFGVLAFGMKKKSKIKNYLLLGFKDHNEERNIVLESRHLEQITQTIRKYAFN